jgi:hypothetical protein
LLPQGLYISHDVVFFELFVRAEKEGADIWFWLTPASDTGFSPATDRGISPASGTGLKDAAAQPSVLRKG